MVDITVFSAAGCGKCVSTKAAIKSAAKKSGVDIDLHEVRVDTNREAFDHFKAAGFSQLPVVMAHRSDDDEVPDIWTDFHPDLVKALVEDREVPETYIPGPV